MTVFRDTFLSCPRCRATLERAGSVWACRPCRGCWVEEPILDEMLRTMHDRPERPVMESRDVPASIPCAQCSEGLAAVVLEGVPVDRCRKGHGVWFDVDELETALRNAAPTVPSDQQSTWDDILDAFEDPL